MAVIKTINGALRVDLLPPYGENAVASNDTIRISDDNGNAYTFFGDYTYVASPFGPVPTGPVYTAEFSMGTTLNFRVTEVDAQIEYLTDPETSVYDAVSYVLRGEDKVFGLDMDDVLAGGDSKDRLVGRGGSDTLYGEAGNDLLDGGDGVDFLIGGLGADRMKGGAGGDFFVFNYTDESGNRSSERDQIMDFSQAEGDKVDLRTLDGNPFVDNLVFVTSFSGAAGEVLIEQVEADRFVIRADLDGNGRSDFAITVETVAGSSFGQADILGVSNGMPM